MDFGNVDLPADRRTRRRLALGAVGAVALFAPVLFTSFYVGVFTRLLILAAFATVYNLAFGFGDIPAFGPAVFYGIGTYGYVMTIGAFPGSVLLPVGVAVGVAFAYSVFVGVIATRGSGIYFALLTFAFAQVVYEIAFRATSVTGGSSGLLVDVADLPFGRLLLEPAVVYYLALAVLIAFLLAVRHVVNSPFGKVIQAVRYNEARAEALGYPVRRVKIVVFVAAMTLSAIPGVLVAINNQFVSTSVLHFEISIRVIIVTLLGGVGTLAGPVVGAGFLIALGEVTRDFANVGTLLTGGILVLVVLYLPDGIVGLFDDGD
jgi:branched-chain amino acid transport system permease protein